MNQSGSVYYLAMMVTMIMCSQDYLAKVLGQSRMNNIIFGTKFPQGYVNLVLRDELYSRMRMMIQHFSRGWSYYTHNWSRGCHGSVLFDPSRDQYDMELVNAFDRSGRYAKSLPNILQPLDITSYNLLAYCGALTLQWMKDIGLLKEDIVTYQTMYPHWYISWEWG